ncbi:MAG: hypothetical protein KAJ18_06245 [Candidatus Omnitrophica bacterium]|nr:hypothetical protein [Candidatus Omnitrophota bacterium]
MKRLIFILVFVVSCVPAMSAQEQGQPLRFEEELFVYEDHGKRDPFWRLVNANGSIISYDKDVAVTDLILGGIVTGKDGNNVAIINGAVVGIKDSVGIFVIQRITTDAVILQKGEEIFTLKLNKEE